MTMAVSAILTKQDLHTYKTQQCKLSAPWKISYMKQKICGSSTTHNIILTHAKSYGQGSCQVSARGRSQ